MTIRRIPNLDLPRNFKDWSSLQVRDVFNLSLKPELVAFQAWSSARYLVPDAQAYWMEKYRDELLNYHEAWNEVELMMHFIGPFLKLIGYGGTRYGLFFNRKLQATIGKLRLNGTVDGVIAVGYNEPVVPYFFLKEYKKSQGYDSEPFGQLLAAMVAAQLLNGDGQPLYGCYVIGKYWSFVYLEGESFASTQGYDATDPAELQIIWSMLVEVKRVVEERVAQLMEGEV